MQSALSPRGRSTRTGLFGSTKIFELGNHAQTLYLWSRSCG